MSAWRTSSPFRAVGIYIAGYSRACRSQPNLTSTWVATQLAAGWHLLPITLGPQASCQPRFPRYGTDYRINSNPTNDYAAARSMGTNEASKTVSAAKALGLVPDSTMFYDLEGFDYTNTRCRESALRFLSAWTVQIRKLGYRSGVYSSVGSGIKVLERQRLNPLPNIVLPDQLWLARYDGKANTSSPAYLSDAGWAGNRVKQYQGGHDERWGGVTINIDRNYLDLRSAPRPATATPASAPPETHCGGAKVDLPAYVALRKPTSRYTPASDQVVALKCLLKERATFRGRVAPGFGRRLASAIQSWRLARGMRVNNVWTRGMWMELLASGTRPALRPGAVSPHVRDAQRALNAANLSAHLSVSGVLDTRTQAVLNQWKARVGLRSGGMVGQSAWRLLAAGRF
jgi:peptidoglycan hydrolase-like protein with peptidoglycan-binding domain